MKRKILILLTLPTLLTQSACLTGRQALSSRDEPRELPLLWQRSGHDNRIKRPFRYVAHDANALARLPLAQIPVDFDNQMILIASPGPQRSPDVQIRIQELWIEGQQIRVRIDVFHPSDGQAARTRMQSPYHIVVVPKSTRNIEGFSTSLPRSAFQSGGPQ